MDGFVDNSIIKNLQSIFKDYISKPDEFITKLNVIKFFFDYKLIDSCGYNIFEINSFLNQLNPKEDKITMKMFLILLFYIYKRQMENFENNNEGTIKSNESSVSQMTVNDINNIVDDQLQIYKTNNIIKLMLEKKDGKESPYKFQSPDFTKDEIKYVCSYEILTFLSAYMHSIETSIFDMYAISNNNQNNITNFKYVNLTKLNNLFFDFPIFANFSSEKIATYMELFIDGITPNTFETFQSLFDERMTPEQIKEIFDSFYYDCDLDEMNFSYSGLTILLVLFALKLESSENLSYQEALEYMFETAFGLKTDNANLTEQVQEEEEEEIDYEFIPESETLNNVKNFKYNDDDNDFINEFLNILDNILPQVDNIINSFKNDIPFHSNTISTNKYNVIPAKFPLERLQVEIDEERERETAIREGKRIAKAKKAKKRNARDPPPKEIYMDEYPKEEIKNKRYLGSKIINTLTNRVVKNTFKEIIANTNVYPSLIRETLILPSILPSKIKEMIIECYKDQIKGHSEIAIRRLERARNLLRDLTNEDDIQVELFFELTFGTLYEDLDFDLQAMKNYYEAKKLSDKLIQVDPDNALVYSYLGALFLKLNELDWSLRCFQKAKELREKTIGGDTLDTAAIYNNLGVVSFYMESFLPANSYFNLAYEITKSILGLRNPRTLFIKSNISKMSQLNFNKEISFKTLGKYPTPTMLVKNPKRKKK